MSSLKKISLLITALLLSFSLSAQAEDSNQEQIKSFVSEINIQKNSSVEITETIQYFFPNPSHGIVRSIPTKYELPIDPQNPNAGSKTSEVYLTIENVNSIDANNEIRAVPFTKKQSGGNLEIKIGDANQTVSGDQTYQIKYLAQKVINFSPKGNENQDEFYWNVTGIKQSVPILKSSATLNFPKKVDPNSWQFACFTGGLGSTAKECDFEATGDQRVKFQSRWELNAGEGLTIIAGFPKQVVDQPSTSESFWLSLQKNFWSYLSLLLPILTFIFLLILWFLKGRDPKGQGVIIPFYAPPDNLTPVEIGTLIDEKADPKDISSAILNLAVHGYLKIREVENKALFGLLKGKNDYILIKIRDNIGIPSVEKRIFDTIFEEGDTEIKVSTLQDRFPQALPNIKNDIYQDLVDKKYFPRNPEKVRRTYASIGTIVMVVGFFAFINNLSFIFAGSLFLTGFIILIFGSFMPRKTLKGVRTHEQILGLKEYLQVAEADRLKFHNAPEKKPEVFEKLLPYAMVLGVEKEWAKQFEGIYLNPPRWYEGSSLNTFNTLYLVSSLSSFNQVTNASMGIKTEGMGGAASGLSGFGSGGFSGGGFGGGGTSSW